MRIAIFCAAILASLCAVPLSAADMRTGAAAVNIEADDSMVIAGGIGPGKATGQEGQLHSVAVVIEKTGAGKVAIVACDVLFVTRDFVDPALAQIEKSTGIAPSQVLVNATHTHHAPCTATVHGYVRDDVFTKRVQDAIVKSVEEANARLAGGESDFYFKLTEEKTIGANSRVLLSDNSIWWGGSMDDSLRHTGPFDPQLPVLAFRGADQKPRALLYNHSTHTIGSRKPGVHRRAFTAWRHKSWRPSWVARSLFWKVPRARRTTSRAYRLTKPCGG